MTTRTVFPSDAVDPIVHKLIYFWYGRGIFDEGGRWKETPLLEAARTGDEAACFLLLEMMGSKCKNTCIEVKPAMYTSMSPDTSGIYRTINARNVRNRNALHCAVAGSNVAIAQLLLRCDKFSIMVTEVDIRGETPVHAAVRAGNVEMVQLLLTTINRAPTGNHVRDGDYRSTAHQLKDKIQSILNIQNKLGETPLHIASERDSTPLYNRNFPSVGNVTAMLPNPAAASPWGCGFADNRVASPIIGAKDSVSASSYGQRRQSIVELLLRNGSSIHSKDKTGSTPLHKAAAEGQLDIVGLLVDSGANIQLLDNSGRTPLDVAKLWGHKTTACLLECLLEWKPN